MATSWFYYIAGSLGNPSSYDIASGTPNCPNPNNQLCAIFAEIQFIDGIQRPIITPALLTEIANALNTKTESANVLLKP